MTCPARFAIVYEVWGFKKEIALGCKLEPGHKGAHQPQLPMELKLQGTKGESWAIKRRF